MKKYSILLIFAFLMQIFSVPALGEELQSGWTVSYHGEFADESGRAKYLAESFEKYKFDGAKSVVVKCQTSDKADENYVELKNTLVGVPETGIYTLKFHVKTTSLIDGELCFGNTVTAISSVTPSDVTAPSGDTYWKEYTAEINYEKTDNAVFSFRFYNNIRGIYIDDVTLSLKDGGENIITDSGFEGEIKTEAGTGGGEEPGETPGGEPDVPGGDVEETYDTTPYQPISFMSSGYKKGVLLTWKNPATDTLTDVKIYEITDEEEILLSDEVTDAPSKYVYYKAECDGETPRQYKVVFSYSDCEDRIYFLSDIPGDKGASSNGGWSLRRYMEGPAKYCPADVYIDSETGHESETSLKIVSNIDRSVTELQSNIYTLVIRTIGMEAGKKYSISFWVKGENVVNAPQVHMNFVKFENTGSTVSGITGTNDWIKKEHTYVYSTQNALSVLVEGLCGALWFDDFECYELDADGNKVGDNLISDGDFEGVISRSVGNLTDFKAEPGIGSVAVSYKKPAEKYSGAKLYQKVQGNYEYRGIISGNTESFNITGLQENKEYEFRIVPFNSDRVEGVAEDFTVTTLLRDYDITEPVVYKGNSVVDALSGAGEYKVVTTAKNNLLGDNLNYEQLVGIYKNNTLVKVYSTKQSVPQTAQNAPYTNTETVFTVPEGDSYKVKIFVVDSRKSPELYYKAELS